MMIADVKSLVARLPVLAVIAFGGATAAVVVTDPAGSATARLCERDPDDRRCAPNRTVVTTTTTTTERTTPDTTPYLFADEFDGTALDTSKWWASPSCENDTLESYNCKNAANAFVEDGYLHLRASVGTMGRPTDGARIQTFVEGSWPAPEVKWSAPAPIRIEARMKFAAGAGLWSAFWPVGDSATSLELDVHEYRGVYPTYADCHVHTWGGLTGYGASGRVNTGVDLTAEFHTYWVNYYGTHAESGVDAFRCGDFPTPEQRLMIRLDNRVGTPGTWGGEGGPPSALPADTLVDYVRVTAL
jgi:hypothetical protein